jgi:DNA-directed RNA polymerase specialized sigma24 family protein
VIRSPWQRAGGWSPEEAAAELQQRRAELIGQLRRRGDARGVPPGAQEEIVDEAIAAVVMSPHGTSNQDHLIGAFWIAVAHRCARHREGRPFTRLGSRQRVDFESAVEHAPGPGDPFETVELTDRMARAADLIAELDPRERQILAVMASYGIGPVPTARHLGLPLGEVRSADRSIKLKLNRVAAIAAAGRMCEFRYDAILADAAGEASDRDAARASAHVNACVPCGRVYRKLRREMRGREFQRAAAAAFLPLPTTSLAHVGGLGRVATWIQQHTPRVLPHGGGERAAEVLGGAGAVKVAAVGTAVVIAGGTLTSHIVHSVVDSHPPAHRHAGRLLRRTSSQSVKSADSAGTWAKAWASPTTTTIPAAPRTTHRTAVSSRRGRLPARHSSPAPPSKSLGYLALGGSSGSTSSSSSVSSSPAHAVVASVDRAPRTGGGSDLSYLGR